MERKKLLAFTLAEVMTVVVILGILAAILIPVITKALPNKSKTMFQKAYYTTEKVAKELITNEGLYPYDKNLIGFMNTTTVTYNGKTYDKPTTKFAELFASALNINGAIDWDSEYNFTTNDGIVWSLQQADPTKGVVFNKGESILIHVDVLGGTQNTNTRKNPNCFYDATTCPNPDRFNIYVYNDGQMLVTGKKEVEYLNGIQTDPRVGCENHWQVAKATCGCAAGTSCDCPQPGNVWDGSGCHECQDGEQCLCTSPQTWHKEGSTCCTANTTCNCTGGKYWNGSSCVSCTGGRSWDGSSCVCTGGTNWDGSTCCTTNTTCNCTGGQYWGGSSCVNCTGGRTWNGSSCECSSGTWDGSTCYTAPTCNITCGVNYIKNPSTCACDCNITCSGNYIKNASTCACDCNIANVDCGAKVKDTSTCSCVNPTCDITCAGNFTKNTSTCSCDCNISCAIYQNKDSSACTCTNKVCAAGYTLNTTTGNCDNTCSAGYHWQAEVSACKVDCTHSTGDDPYDYNYQSCVCGGNLNKSPCTCTDKIESCNTSSPHFNHHHPYMTMCAPSNDACPPCPNGQVCP